MRPEIFIAGTMKGGTTILYDSVCTHPEIWRGRQKEIHYFSFYPYKGMEWYLSHFEAGGNRKCVDASPTYFDFAQCDAIPRMINKSFPGSKILLIVRDPVARAVSHFYHMQKVVKTPWLEPMGLNEFFAYPFERVFGQTSPQEWLLNQILWFSCYFRKYVYYRQVFGAGRILVLSNDQLRHRPLESMKKTFDFLGLDFVDSDIFGTFKYSTGSSVNHLDGKIYTRLKNALYPDFEKFSEVSGITCDTELA